MHYIGIGVTLPVDGWRNDYLYEFAGNSLEYCRQLTTGFVGRMGPD
jgi:hypothetical protein